VLSAPSVLVCYIVLSKLCAFLDQAHAAVVLTMNAFPVEDIIKCQRYVI
jgi:hypothetical protein